jgi:hypothetical protein
MVALPVIFHKWHITATKKPAQEQALKGLVSIAWAQVPKLKTQGNRIWNDQTSNR